jgi:hypothetical protein
MDEIETVKRMLLILDASIHMDAAFPAGVPPDHC